MARLLVVEDDPSVREFTARALIAEGHDVTAAEDGEMGLALIEGSDPYDLVLSDIRMPVMDGIEMSKKAVELRPAQRILLMTGYAEQKERAAELDGIVEGVVQKPFSLNEIRQFVSKALR